jgi:hypothetical protein
MKYRDIEYTVLQGIDVWKSTASVSGGVIMGHAVRKSGAVTAAEKAIDRALALASKRVRLVLPDDRD